MENIYYWIPLQHKTKISKSYNNEYQRWEIPFLEASISVQFFLPNIICTSSLRKHQLFIVLFLFIYIFLCNFCFLKVSPEFFIFCIAPCFAFLMPEILISFIEVVFKIWRRIRSVVQRPRSILQDFL